MTRKAIIISTLTLLGLSLSGCAQTGDAGSAEPTAVSDADPFVHIHGIADAPDGGGVLVATHSGLYRIDDDGDVTGPIGGNDADLMGLAIADGVLFASGHPGANTPAELGTPNLGVIRSDDTGENWVPVAFTGVEDFHILTDAPDGSLYGIGSTTTEVRGSRDGGGTWSNGADLPIADMTVGADGELYAATESGLQLSRDEGMTFSSMPDTPLLYSLDAFADGTLIGVDTDGLIWRSLVDGGWESIGETRGAVQALAAGESGTILIADDRGLVRVDETGETVMKPAGRDGDQP